MVALQVIPWLVRSGSVWFTIYESNVTKGESLRTCSTEHFALYFRRNMAAVARPPIVVRGELGAALFTESELRHLATGLDSCLF